MVLGVEHGLEREICVEQMSEFKYLGCNLDQSNADVAECSRKV